MSEVEQTFENNGRQVNEELIDPGPVDVVRRRDVHAARTALSRVEITPMRKGVPPR